MNRSLVAMAADQSGTTARRLPLAAARCLATAALSSSCVVFAGCRSSTRGPGGVLRPVSEATIGRDLRRWPAGTTIPATGLEVTWSTKVARPAQALLTSESEPGSTRRPGPHEATSPWRTRALLTGTGRLIRIQTAFRTATECCLFHDLRDPTIGSNRRNRYTILEPIAHEWRRTDRVLFAITSTGRGSRCLGNRKAGVMASQWMRQGCRWSCGCGAARGSGQYRGPRPRRFLNRIPSVFPRPRQSHPPGPSAPAVAETAPLSREAQLEERVRQLEAVVNRCPRRCRREQPAEAR